ncbi:MAG TPA: transglycosylase SLT domain-containing protein, partial [Thermoleophilia bacterium]|nr:transglycosylase SLT domain-containing protein [Thermoleophilia bacterium]
MPEWTSWVPVYKRDILRAAGEYSIEPVKLAAVVMQESAGDARAYRYEPAYWDRYLADKPEYGPPAEGEGALHLWKRRVSASYGLCQLMYPTAVWLMGGAQFAPEELFEPGLSLDLGARLLRLHLDKGRTWRQSLAAYNTGRARDD